jgi:hypothetical protein
LANGSQSSFGILLGGNTKSTQSLSAKAKSDASQWSRVSGESQPAEMFFSLALETELETELGALLTEK